MMARKNLSQAFVDSALLNYDRPFPWKYGLIVTTINQHSLTRTVKILTPELVNLFELFDMHIFQIGKRECILLYSKTV